MTHDLRAERIAFELPIDAPRGDVWKAMIRDIGDWWPTDFRATRDTLGFHFEDHPGGRVWEETADGGLVWFTVQALERERSVNLAGFTGPPWGGPSATTLYVELRATDGDRTLLAITDASFGQLPPPSDVENGWRTIFGSLADHVRDRRGSAAQG